MRVWALVLGAGPAGCAAALKLASSGRAVAIADPPTPSASPGGETLSPAINGMLAELEVGDLGNDGVALSSPGVISSWGGPAAVCRDFLFSPFGAGWHVDRAAFDARLRTAVLQKGIRRLAAGFRRGIVKLRQNRGV